MKHAFFLLLLAVITSYANVVCAQTQIICNGKKITIDEKTTFVFDAKSKFAWSFIINDKAIYLPKPEYPKEAKEKKLRGAVNVQVNIDEQGKIISANAVSGHDLLRAPAVESALRAKFKKLISGCQPKEYSGIIIYNFTGEDENKQSQNSVILENNIKQINLGDVTKKAVYLPRPRVPINIQFPRNEVVRVRVVIDLSTGKVTEAKAISGLQRLRPYAEKVAQCARFTKSSNVEAKAAGYITYKFDDSSKSSMADFNGGVLNGKAISLPQPILPPGTNFSGSISVHVDLDEEGNVISARSGYVTLCLGEIAVEAAKKAKFTKTFLGRTPVKVSGVIVYGFPPRK